MSFRAKILRVLLIVFVKQELKQTNNNYKHMIYVGEVFSRQGCVAGPIFGDRCTVEYSLKALREYIIKDFDDTVCELRCQTIFTYGFKKLQEGCKRLFSIKAWKIYTQNAKARKALRKRRRLQFRKEAQRILTF